MKGKDLIGEHVLLNVRIPAALDAALRDVANARETSRSDVAREALEVGAERLTKALARKLERSAAKGKAPAAKRGRKAAA